MDGWVGRSSGGPVLALPSPPRVLLYVSPSRHVGAREIRKLARPGMGGVSSIALPCQYHKLASTCNTLQGRRLQKRRTFLSVDGGGSPPGPAL